MLFKRKISNIRSSELSNLCKALEERGIRYECTSNNRTRGSFTLIVDTRDYTATVVEYSKVIN